MATETSSRTEPRPSKPKGCMMCRTEIRVEHFHELKPGDQISMPGRVRILGNLYSHHAVVANVEDISDDGLSAKLTVIDVDEKGKTSGCCPCDRKPFPVKEHGLYGKECHVLETRCVSLGGKDAVVLRKVVYRKRKFNKQATVERARICSQVEKEDEVRYCFCLQNCEHFAVACVNGPDSLIEESLAESISVQALDFLWILISFIFWALQALFYGFNFWMYAVFVAKDPDFNFLTTQGGLRAFLEEHCVNKNSLSKHFETTCDWKSMGFFILVFTFLFIAIVLTKYVPLYRKKYLCRLCIVQVGIDLFFSRLFVFVVVETISILSDEPLYQLVSSWKMNRAETILTLMIVSAGGAILVYSLASLLTKTIMWLCGLCSSCAEGFHRFIHLKGLAWCCWKARCCCRDRKRKYFVEETELTESTKQMNSE